MADDAPLMGAFHFHIEIAGASVPIVSLSGGASEPATSPDDIDPLVVEAYVTKDNKVLANVAKEATESSDAPLHTIVVTQRDGDETVIRRLTYSDCVFVSLELPSVKSRDGSALTELATFQPQRLSIR